MSQVRFLQNRSFSRPDLGLGGSFIKDQVVVGVDDATALRLEKAGIVTIVRPAQPASPPVEMTAREDGMQVTTRELKAVHRGRGSWSVMEGDAELVEQLDRKQAAAFNRLDEAGKSDWVRSRAG